MIGAFLGACWRTVHLPAVSAAESYIRAVAEQDRDTALKISSGKAAYIANGLGEGRTKANVAGMRSCVEAASSDWAKVVVEPELVLEDGTRDIGWYEAEVIKKDGWKVIDLKEAAIPLSGTRVAKDVKHLPAINEAFEGYLKALTAGDLKGASRYLVGPARKSHEAGESYLGKGAIVASYSGLQSKVLWSDGDLCRCLMSYRVNGRDVEVSLVFARLKNGDWKIASI
ncbi:MAG: hypothetical protein NUV48_07110 [Peptococcaceae bacterium]|nr:hypothetical protein [Peptococcaceae bacterium]